MFFYRVDPQVSLDSKQLGEALETEVKAVCWLENFFELNGCVRIANSELYKSGKIYGIDVSSGAAVAMLGPKEGDHCLDLCCSPGAKLSMIANMCTANGSGSVTGVDVSKERISSCRTVVQKYKLKNVRLFNCDGTKFAYGPEEGTKDAFFVAECMDDHVEKEMGDKRGNVKYDKVLVDAECTHDGSLKHIVKFNKWGWDTFEKRFLDSERISTLTVLQKSLLENGFNLLKDDGELVYSTCSFSRKQNEEVVIWLLEKYNNARVMPVELPNLPVKAPMHQDLKRKINGIERADLLHMVRFDPLVSGTSGLFVAKIKKMSLSDESTVNNDEKEMSGRKRRKTSS